MEIAILVIALIAHLTIGLFTFFHSPRSATHRLFLTFTVVAAVWALVQYLSLHQPTPETTLNVIRWAMAMAILYSFFLYLTIHTFPSSQLRLSRGRLIFFSLLSIVIFCLSRTNLIFSDIKGFGASAEPLPGPAIPLFGLATGFFILGSIYLLISRYRRAKGIEKAQLQYLIIGVIGSAFLMFFTNFVLVVLFKVTSLIILGPTYTLIFIGATAYAIVAHHLFDIRIIIKRTLVYSGLLLFAVIAYSLIVFFFAALFGKTDTFDTRNFVTDIIAACIIALGFEPLRRWLVKVTDRYLFVGEYDPQVVIAELAQTLSSVLDLDEALQSMMKAVTKALRVKKAATFILKTEKDKTVVKRVQGVGYGSSGQLTLDSENLMTAYFAEPKHELLVTDEVRAELEAHPDKDLAALLKEMTALDAAVAIPIRVSDKLIGILIMGSRLSGDVFSISDLQFLDIVAKQTAAAIEKSRFYEDDQLKSEFVSIASHELLTPTAAIEGYLSMILDEKMAKVDKKAEDYLRKVQSSARRLSELVTDLLSVSRIEGGRIVINKQPVEVSAIIKKVIDEIGVKASQSDIKLTYLAPSHPLPKVLADPERVAQIATNLISNAIKYNKPKGTIDVAVEADKKMATVTVADTGIGIAPAHLPHLFEKFYRVHDDSAAAEKIGTGLGLYITRSIVELQGGKITVESKPGKGSTFRFTLPVA